MSDPCARWALLSDREALGERLAERDASFLQAHGASCAQCGAEDETWRTLRSLLDGDAQPRPSAHGRRVSPLSRWTGTAAVAVACAAAIVLAWIVSERGAVVASGRQHAGETLPEPKRGAAAVVQTTAPAPSTLALAAAARIASTGGAVDVDGVPARFEQALPVGALVYARVSVTCLSLDPGVRACLAPGSLLRVVDVGAARRLELLNGRIAARLDPQPAGSGFAILTRDGSALAVGTAFSVEAAAAGRPSVTRVLHGTVLVRSASGVELRVTAQHAASMRGEWLELAPRDEARDQALLRGESASAPPAGPAAGRSNRARFVPSASDSLQLARECAAAGDVDGALAAYRGLFDRYGDSAEAHAARVPYGELLLGARANPQAALDAFEHYLSSGGALAEEASFGRVRALRALHRTADERAAIESFLHAFPDGPLATALRGRERELGARVISAPKPSVDPPAR